jgi:hypothetical protein
MTGTPGRSGRAGHGWLLRSTGLILAVILATAGAAVGATPASAAALPMGDCTTTSGVVLVVDFGHWGGPLLRSCASTPTTGYALLNEGGWQTTGTEHDGPGFICRIGYSGYDGGAEFPPPAQQSCVLTPPASAYWAYWEAGPDQDTWSYSSLGPMSSNPAPGSVELWVFGGTNLGGTSGSAVPAFSPDSVRALNSAPVGAGSASPAPAPTQTTMTTARPSQAVRSAAVQAVPSATPADAPVVLNAPPAAASSRVSGGSPAAAVATLVIVVLLAIGGITAAARRPRRER